jgi:Putative Ig domain
MRCFGEGVCVHAVSARFPCRFATACRDSDEVTARQACPLQQTASVAMPKWLARLWDWLKTRWRRFTEILSGARDMDDDRSARSMSPGLVALLLFLLGSYFAIASYVGWTVWNSYPLSEPSAARGDGSVDVASPLRIDSVTPGAIVPRDAPVGLLVFGQGFDAETAVLVNGTPPGTARLLATGRFYLELSPQEQRAATRLAISARTNDSIAPTSSNMAVVVSANADFTPLRWSIWMGRRWSIEISQETRFLLLTLLMGSVGGALTSLQSLGTFRGQRRLFGSWFVHYLVSPFVAGGIALFLYFTIRAGFLSGTTVTIDPNVLPWGLLAVSALGGLFYDRAFLKLREVFLTLFQVADERSGKLHPKDEPPAGDRENPADDRLGVVDLDALNEPIDITTSKLPVATAGQAYEAQLEARGAPAGLAWSVLPGLPAGLQLHPGTGVISGTPVQKAPSRSYVFAVENLIGVRASTSLELEVL